jgi:hypothetical protein
VCPRVAHPGGVITTNKAYAMAKFFERKGNAGGRLRGRGGEEARMVGGCRGGGRGEENESSLGANSEEGNGARGGSTGTDAGSDSAVKGRCEQQQVGRSSQQ